jgi:hypothetical protein
MMPPTTVRGSIKSSSDKNESNLGTLTSFLFLLLAS